MSESGIDAIEPPAISIWESVKLHFDAILENNLSLTTIDPLKVERVASIGCGTFFEASSLANSFPNAEVVGIDREGGVLRQARKFPTFPKGVIMMELDLSKPDTQLQGKFDVLVLRNPDIHRIDNWRQIMEKCRESMAKEGLIIVSNHTQEENEQTLPLLDGLDIKVNKANSSWPENSPMKSTDNYVIFAQKPKAA